MFIRLASSCIFLAVLSFPNLANADIVIDDFSAGSTIAQFGSGSSFQTTIHSSILGDARDTTLNVPDLGGDEFFGVIGFGSGLQLAQGASDQINGRFLYNNFGTIDLTDGGSHSFALQVVASDSTVVMPNALAIRITSGATSSIFSFDIPGNGSIPSQLQVGFGNFAGVDLSNVDSIELMFNLSGSPGTDLVLGSFTTIPEPISGIAGLAFMLGIVCCRRRST